MRNTYTFLLCVFVVYTLAGCSGSQAPSGGKIPPWVLHTPSDSKYIYAVGISGRTFHPTDAIKYAKENARKEMAGMIRTRIVSMTKTRDSGRRESISIESVAVTDEDLQGSEVVKRWMDKEGASGVAPGTTYVLIRLTRSKYEELINKYK